MSDQKILTEIRERLVRVETKIDNTAEIQDTAFKAKKTATEAMLSTRSAHKRIDKIDKAIFWLVTSVIGGVIMGVLGILFIGGN